MISRLNSLKLLTSRRKRALAQDVEEQSPKRPNLASGSLVAHSSESYCQECDIHFSRPYTFRRHVEDVHGSGTKLTCDEDDCGKVFTRKDTLARHKDMQHGTGKITCSECGSLVRKSALPEHLKTAKCHKKRTLESDRMGNALSDELPQPDQSHSNWTEGQGTYDSENDDAMEVDTIGQSDPSTSVSNAGTTTETPQTSETDSSTLQTPTSSATASLVAQNSSESDDAGCPPLFAPVERRNTNLKSRCSWSELVPEIIPDSPRPPLYDASYSPLWFEDSQKASSLASDIECQKSELSFPGAFTDERDSIRTQSFLESSHPPQRFYEMSLGSRCALCSGHLGHSPETVYQHAKRHAQPGPPLFECSVCRIKFQFEADLELHSSKTEIWAFCRHASHVENHEQDDWVAKASNAEREALIRLIRSWEALQRSWYLHAIHQLLNSQKCQEAVSRSRTERAPIMAGSVVVVAKAFTQRGYDHRQNYISIDSLTEKFSHTTITSGYYSDLKHCPTLKQSRASVAKDGRVAESLLRDFAAQGRAEAVRKLLDDKTDLNSIDTSGETALIKAIRNRHVEVAKLLIDNGADVKKPTRGGSSPLFLAYLKNLPDVVELLAIRKVDVNQADKRGDTPLAYAITAHASWMIEILLKYGATVSPSHARGIAALMHAAGRHDPHMAELLVENVGDELLRERLRRVVSRHPHDWTELVISTQSCCQCWDSRLWTIYTQDPDVESC